MRRLIFLLPLVVLAALLVFFLRGLDPSRDPSAIDSPLIGKALPTFSAPALLADKPGIDSRDFADGDLRGKVVAVNFFASWCLPCRAEHPVLKQLTSELGIPVIGIAYKDKKDAAAGFLAEMGNPYLRVGTDEPGRIGIDFGITGVPETFIIDKQGIVRHRIGGPLNPQLIDEEIAPLVRELNK
ncbi:DsbE family thiol:disulfide interchange protein [Dongia soli]|uniref:DsbE family thiol:disulfide interchange protein n=1 Tax=Dongia soli TaxID=600628 RepID=A0ABU5E6C6_9PROT|nr:DsbE family thiol:disulfide interchange protein [Dongia soli]MDY0881875.1 DsbE family thiol:disulfide interchange protein [Dongia soli]